MLIARLLAASLILAIPALAAAAPAPRGAVAPDRVQAALDKAVAAYDLPGATAAILPADGQLRTFASGFADKEAGRRMTPNTRMMSGSIGKMFVSAVALSLAQDGVLDLDAPVSRLLGPEFAQLPNYDRITARMLLSHSSGLPDHVYMESFWAVAKQRVNDADFAFAPRDLVAFGFSAKPLFEPGKGYGYTDLGYILLGLVIEKAAGQSYYSLAQQRFLYPLALSATGPSNGRIFDGLAQGYLDPANPLLGGQATTLDGGVFRINTSSEWTGGGLVTSAGDLASWVSDLFEGRTRLGKDALQMVANPVESGKGPRYGLGVHVYDTEYGPLWGHGGWFMGYRSFIGYFPKCRLAAAIQVNSERVDKAALIFKQVFASELQAGSCAPAGLKRATDN